MPKLTHGAIIENRDKSETLVVHWCENARVADEWTAQWMRDNEATRPFIRCTIVQVLFSITD